MDLNALDSLSTRQAECLRLVARDRDAKEIGRILGISDETVERHIKLALKKLGSNSRFAAARALAEREGRTHPVVMPFDRGERFDFSAASSDADTGSDPNGPAPGGLREERVAFEHLAWPSRPPAKDEAGVRNRLGVPSRLALCAAAFLVVAIGIAGIGAAMRQLGTWMHPAAVTRHIASGRQGGHGG